MENGKILSPDWAVSHLPKGGRGEEIDLLVRIGTLVIVAEIKCLLSPSEPNECYNYLRKLEKASEQARRKAAWLESKQVLAQQLLGGTSSLKMMPLVVVNQSNGVGLVFDGCQVTDAHFLCLVLADGKYHSGATFNGDATVQFNEVTLYSSVKEAEAIMPNVFADHAGLRRYRDAVEWSISKIPLAGNFGELMISYPYVNGEKFWISKLGELDKGAP